MGIFDVIKGKRKLKTVAPDRLFALSTAYVTLDSELGITSQETAAIVFQPLRTADFESVTEELDTLVKATAEDSGTTVQKSEDEYGYQWNTLKDSDFEDLVVGINAVSSALTGSGYSDRLLCAVFAFKDRNQHPVYLIYNYKRGSFYPFIPAGSGQERNSERELRLKAQLSQELPFEAELERWFPLWGTPI